MMFLLSLAWWQYALIIIGLLLAGVAYVIYKGYSKIRAVPLKGPNVYSSFKYDFNYCKIFLVDPPRHPISSNVKCARTRRKNDS